MAFTKVLVRVQARGGKFLGPDAGYAQITLKDALSGRVLAQGVAEGDSGALSGSFSPSATRQAIVTPAWGTQATLWLSAVTGEGTAGFAATLELDAPTRVEITATALTGGTPNGHSVTETMWMVPGADLTQEPGVVLVMPGLIVDKLSAVPTPGAASVGVTAWVAMMCGCKIDPALPWLPSEFAVSAVVTDSGGAVVATAPLAFQATSTFGTAEPIALPGPGTYTVAVSAVQAAEGNVGSASTPFTVPG